jgi:DNA-binding PadR family transcriptional regulator
MVPESSHCSARPLESPRYGSVWRQFDVFRRRSPVRRGGVRAAVLLLVAMRPTHGYQIIQEIAERSGGLWRPSPGSVYPAIRQLEDEGLLRIERLEGRRMLYLTESGRAYLNSHRKELIPPWDTVSSSLAEGARELRELVKQFDAVTAHVSDVGTASQIVKAKHVLEGARGALYEILMNHTY